LVALSYSQNPGADFSESYSPVVDDSSFCLILLLIAKLKLKAWSLDVETPADNLDEDFYMKIPDGFEMSSQPKEEETRVLKLEKSLYGLVQAARQWNRNWERKLLILGLRRTIKTLLCSSEPRNKVSACSASM
jgi:Reverse transcriptase (RNA-dependent DNA polymerase)